MTIVGLIVAVVGERCLLVSFSSIEFYEIYSSLKAAL